MTDYSKNPFNTIDYSKLGKSVSGRAWLEKAIHPPGLSIAPVTGMPDNDCFPSTSMEFRNTYTLSTPLDSDPTWSALILFMPSAELPAVWWPWSTSQAAPVITTPLLPGNYIKNPNYNFANWDTDVSRWRRLYGSATCELNAPSLNDQGMVYCAQQRLEMLASGSTYIPGVAYASEPVIPLVAPFLPTQPTTLQQLSPGFYKQRAKEGCFTVSGLIQPNNLYQPGTSLSVRFGSETAYRTTPAEGQTLDFGTRASTWGTTALNVQSGLSDNWSYSWVLFTGLSNQATVELKMIHGYELQPELGSSFALFVEPPAEPDVDAVNAYYSLRHGMSDGYPAAFNLFGGLGAALSSLIPKIPSVLGALFGGATTTASVASQPAVTAPVPTRPAPPPPVAASIAPTQALRAIESRLANLEVAPRPRTQIVEKLVPIRRAPPPPPGPRRVSFNPANQTFVTTRTLRNRRKRARQAEKRRMLGLPVRNKASSRQMITYL